ncbi:unnamed protein product [Parajaminaea phylloscopi]
MIRPTLSHSLFSSVRAASSRTTARTYASAPASSSSNLPLYLSLGGLAGLGGWYALGGFGDANAAKEKVKDSVPSSLTAGAPVALSKDAFKEFKLKEVKPYNHDSATFIFELPDGQTSGMTTASAVLFKGAGEGIKDKDGKQVIRPYTPVSVPAAAGEMSFLIKKYPGGAMTEHVHGLKVGEPIQIKGPIPKFPYKANEFQHIGMIAGGSGITPMWQVIQDIANNKADKTNVTLIYTNKTEQDILLREEFDKIAANDSRFKVIYGLDKLPKGFKGPTGAFEGYVTPEIINGHMPQPGLADKVRVLVCGPPAQVEAISGGKVKGQQGPLKGLLADAGYQPDQVYKF